MKDAFVIVDDSGAPVCLSTGPLGDDGAIIAERYVHAEKHVESEFSAGLWRAECLEWRDAHKAASDCLRLLTDKTMHNAGKAAAVKNLANKLSAAAAALRLGDFTQENQRD